MEGLRRAIEFEKVSEVERFTAFIQALNPRGRTKYKKRDDYGVATHTLPLYRATPR